MKKGSIAARVIAFSLVLMSVFTLTACKKNTAPEKVKLTNVFKSETIPMDSKVQNIDRMTVSGDIIYFIGSGQYEENGEYKYSTALYKMNADGTGITKLMEMENDSDYEKQIYRSRYFNNMAADVNGYLWAVEVEYYDDYSNPEMPIYEHNTRIKKLDSTGAVIAEVDTKQWQREDEYFYIQYMTFDSAGNLYLCSDRRIFVLNSTTAELVFEVETDNYFNGLSCTAKGDVFAIAWGENGMVLKKIDFAKKDWGETIDLGNSNMYNLLPGSGEYDFFYQDSTSILGYKIDTQESVEVLNWINSDIDNNRINSITSLPDGRMLGIELGENYSEPSLIMLTRKPESEIKETILLTYATMYMGSDVRSAIIKFNRSQDEYRIQVADYSKYSTVDWQAGYDKLNLDIIGGNIPDIINLEGLQVDSYINKGLLADLYQFIDADTEISRGDLLENVLEACSQNGKLYRLVPMFTIYSVVGKESIVGSTPGWSMDDLNALMARMQDGAVAFSEMTKSDILTYSTYMAMDQFINYNTGRCNFDSEEFIKLLEFANSFETEIDWEAIYGEGDWWERRNNAYKEDMTLLMPTYIYNVRSVREAKDQFGEPVTYIGFPTANKNGSCIVPQMELAVSDKSKNKDAAWQFVRSFITEEYYTSNQYYWGLPLNKNVIDAKIQLEMIPFYDRPENNGVSAVISTFRGSAATSPAASMPEDTVPEEETDEEIEDETPGDTKDDDYYDYSWQDDYYENYHLTQQEADQIMQLITSVNQLMYRDNKVNEIITEEVEYYFSGNKTASATANIIQNKIQTYINESR